MSLSLDGETLTIYVSWLELKALASAKDMGLQFVQTSNDVYQIFGLDGRVLYRTNIYSGSYPNFIDEDAGDPSTSADNDAYLYDFETNFKSRMNLPIEPFQSGDLRWIYRLGNLVSTGSQELLVAGNGYFEPTSQAQRGVKSTSANDANPAGSGAKAVRLVYLDANYVRHVEDINLNGTNTVATVNNDIRFVEQFYVIKGTAAAGRIFLTTGANGLGEICSIGSAGTEAFLCHHYVPSGSQAQIVQWGASASDDTQMRLKGQAWFSGNLVDPIYYDLENLVGIASGSLLNFSRDFKTMPVQEKTRIYLTSQAGQGTSTTIRARLLIWEDALYVSGSG